MDCGGGGICAQSVCQELEYSADATRHATLYAASTQRDARVPFWVQAAMVFGNNRLEAVMEPMFHPHHIALGALSEDAQKAIMLAGYVPAMQLLSDSVHLSSAVALELLNKPEPWRFRGAVRKIDDQERIADMARSAGTYAALLARNDNTPTSVLDTIALAGTAASLWALANPRTSEVVRRKVLTADTVTALTMTGQSNSDRLARSMELAFANPWLVERAEKLPTRVQRALVIDPDRLHGTAERINGITPRGWPMTKLIPDGDLAQMSIDALLTSVCSTTALVAVRRDELTLEQARKFCVEGTEGLEAPVLARYLRRFGIAVAEELHLSSTKLQTTAQLEPSGVHCGIKGVNEATALVAPLLGSDITAWKTYFALGVNGHRDVEEMARAAQAVLR